MFLKFKPIGPAHQIQMIHRFNEITLHQGSLMMVETRTYYTLRAPTTEYPLGENMHNNMKTIVWGLHLSAEAFRWIGFYLSVEIIHDIRVLQRLPRKLR